MPLTDLTLQDAESAWACQRWPTFRDWPDKERTLVLCPVVGFTDWGLGYPLDAEEQLVGALLRTASTRKPADLSWLIPPPLRFVAGAHSRTTFPVPLKLAFAQLADWGRSVAASGFQRLVFVNVSPFNEDIVDAAGRDLRIELGLQCFVVNLSGLGLNLHPKARNDRQRAQTILTSVTGKSPRAEAAQQLSPPLSVPPGLAAPWNPPEWPFPAPVPHSEAHLKGSAWLVSAADHFLRLAREIRDRPPLAPSQPSTTPPSTSVS